MKSWRFILLMATVLPLRVSAQQRWRLVEDLRIGGADSGAASFNEIRDLAIDAKGRIFVLDYKTQEIRFFDATGKFVKLVGRRGQGPGEYSEPNGMRLSPDGLLWVNDHNNGRFVVFSAEGSYVKQVLAREWGFGGRWDAAFDSQGRLMEIIPWRSPVATTGAGVRRFDPKSAIWDTVPVPPCLPVVGDYHDWSFTYRTATGGGSIGVPFAPRPVAHLEPTGGWWCGSGIDYHMKLVQLDGGAMVSEIRQGGSQLPIPAKVRDSTVTALEKQLTNVPPGTIDRAKVPNVYPRLQALSVDDKNRLWAYRQGPVGLTIDVWTREGQQVATLDAPRTIYAGILTIVRNERLYTVLLDADGVPTVVRYRIVPTRAAP